MNDPRLFKYLNADRTSPLQNWQWPKVGAWTPKVERLSACESGYHACRPAPHFDLLEWSGEKLYEVELRGEILVADTKVLAPEARLIRECKNWNARTQRLFAYDCAARVLKHFEAKYPDDGRPREAIRIARAFANGKASAKELAAAAAWAAETAAAAWAARAAAAAAAWAAEAALAALAAAAAVAAGAAEKKWQVARLMKYIDGEIE